MGLVQELQSNNKKFATLREVIEYLISKGLDEDDAKDIANICFTAGMDAAGCDYDGCKEWEHYFNCLDNEVDIVNL